MNAVAMRRWSAGVSAPLALACVGLCAVLGSVTAEAQSLRGRVALETRFFPESPLDPDQLEMFNASASFDVDYAHDFGEGRHRLVLAPFARIDQHDGRRTHADLRQLEYQRLGEHVELRLGVLKAFWGVTESNHLVDIVNQVDFVEGIDLAARLGQPGLGVTFLLGDFGVLDVFALSGFRYRTFPGRSGRLRPIPRVLRRAELESPLGRGHVDVAARWSNTTGSFDYALSYFHGTSREPQLLPTPSNDAGEVLSLTPRYDLIHQAGLELQWTLSAVLLKSEMIVRTGQGEPFVALTAGLEYALPTLFGSDTDLTLFLEYTHDRRTNAAFVLLQDDVFAAIRLALNDVQNTAFTLAAIVDVRDGSTILRLEAGRRFGSAFSASLRGFLFLADDPAQPLSVLRRDSHIELTVARHF